MWLLQRFGQHVAAGKREAFALEARIGRQHHHVADLLGGFERHRAFGLRGDAERMKLEPRRALADAEVEAPVRQEIERRQAFRRTGRVVVVRDDLPNAVAEPDVLRLRGGGAEEYLGCGGVRIFVQKVGVRLPMRSRSPVDPPTRPARAHP